MSDVRADATHVPFDRFDKKKWKEMRQELRKLLCEIAVLSGCSAIDGKHLIALSKEESPDPFAMLESARLAVSLINNKPKGAS